MVSKIWSRDEQETGVCVVCLCVGCGAVYVCCWYTWGLPAWDVWNMFMSMCVSVRGVCLWRMWVSMGVGSCGGVCVGVLG